MCHNRVADVPRKSLRLPRIKGALNVLSDRGAEWDW